MGKKSAERSPLARESDSVRMAVRLLQGNEKGGLGVRGRLGWVDIVMKKFLMRQCKLGLEKSRKGGRSKSKGKSLQAKTGRGQGRGEGKRSSGMTPASGGSISRGMIDDMACEEDVVVIDDDETLSEASTATLCSADDVPNPPEKRSGSRGGGGEGKERTIWDELASRAQDIVAPIMIEEEEEEEEAHEEDRPAKRRQGNVLSIDCEMVGAGYGKGGKGRSMLARVAIVDDLGTVLMDEYVKPTERVTDYRTRWSGIRAKDLVGAAPFQEVRQRVAALTRGKVLVGHAIDNDLKILQLPHPPTLTRDTSLYAPLRSELSARKESYDAGLPPSLKALSEFVLGKIIQGGEHCPVEDARATMMLYVRHRRQWEETLMNNM